MSINAYVDDLFSYFERFETNPSQFDTEAFLQTYNGIYAVFQTLRRERERAVAIDQYFLSKIKLTPLRTSELRLLTIQLLITYFEVEADIDSQSDQAYLYCRGQREVKQDVPFFENHLVPFLFGGSALNQNVKLNAFFLDEISRYMNRYGSPPPADVKPEAFDRMSDASKFLLLARRRLAFGKELVKDRGALEHHLAQVEAFSKLAGRARIHRAYLSEWQYLTSISIWTRLMAWLGETLGKIGGAFSSWRYFRLVLRQRKAAFLYYSIITIIAVVAAVYVPMKWLDYSNEKLQQLEQRATEIQDGGGR